MLDSELHRETAVSRHRRRRAPSERLIHRIWCGAGSQRDAHTQLPWALLNGLVFGDRIAGEQDHAPDYVGKEGAQIAAIGHEIADVIAAALDRLDDTKIRPAVAGFLRKAQHIVEAVTDNRLRSAPEVC